MTEEKELPPTFQVHRMEDDDLKKFVRDYVEGRIFTSADLKSAEDAKLVFMPVLFMKWEDIPKEVVNEIGIFWEYLSEAGPRAVNGNPMFMSMRIMWKEDWKRARPAIGRLLEQRKVENIEL